MKEGEQLKELLYKENVGIDELAKFLGMSRSGVYKILDAEKLEFDGKRKMLYYALKILFKEKLDEYFPEYRQSDAIGITLNKQRSDLKVLNYNNFKREHPELNTRNINKRYDQLYFQKINTEIQKINTSIDVLNYLPQINKEYLTTSEYMENHQLYFKIIEDRIKEAKAKDRDMVYRRIFQLPFNMNIEPSTVDIFSSFIQLIPLETLKHIVKCLINFPKESEFYLLKRAIRPFSIVIIDRKVLISEYFKYSYSGNPIPDLIFIQKKLSDDDEIDKLIYSHLKDFNYCTDTLYASTIKLSLLRFKELVLDQEKYTIDRFDKFGVAEKFKLLQEMLST